MANWETIVWQWRDSALNPVPRNKLGYVQVTHAIADALVAEGSAQRPTIGAYRFNYRTPLPYNPAKLFDADTAGGVIDVRQMNRFYQDVGGTQPVTAVGQFVQSFRPNNSDVLYGTIDLVPSVTYEVDEYGPYLRQSIPGEFRYFEATYANKPVNAISMVYLTAGHATVGPNYFVGSHNLWVDDDDSAEYGYLSYDTMEMDEAGSGKLSYTHYSVLEQEPIALTGPKGLAPDLYVAGTPVLRTSLASDDVIFAQTGWNTGVSLDPLDLFNEGALNTTHTITFTPNTRYYGGVYMGKQLAPQELENTKQWVNGMVKRPANNLVLEVPQTIIASGSGDVRKLASLFQ